MVVARHGLAAACAAGVAGCALVSGLSGLDVGPGPSKDAAVDLASERTELPDAGDAGDGSLGPLGEAGAALRFGGGCGTTVNAVPALSFSNGALSVALWVRLDSAVTNTSGLDPIVWNGGRTTTEPGWSLDLGLDDGTASKLVFCVGDSNGGSCTTSYPLPVGHLVHVVATSTLSGTNNGRTSTLYALDATTGQTTHAVGATAAGMTSNWPGGVAFALGGAWLGGACTSGAMVTVDDLRVYSVVVSTTTMDQTYAQPLTCTSPDSTASFDFSEGTGAITRACQGNLSLFLNGGYQWVASPFY